MPQTKEVVATVVTAPFATTRRGVLKALGAVTLASPFLTLGGNAWAQAGASLKFAWNQNAFCFTPVAVAQETGIFNRNGLDISFVNYAGSTDQLLEALATGKADAAVGMTHRWLKSLESGFDVKVVAGLHGGCERLIAYKPSGITKLADLRGKTIGVPNLSDPGKHFFSAYLKRNGIDPDREVSWLAYQPDLLGLAAEKGEIHALATSDPLLYQIEKDSKGAYLELATNTSPPYHDKTCCILGVGGVLLRDNRAAVAALARSLVEAYEWTAAHIDDAAQIFHKYTTKISLDELRQFYKQLTLHEHPTGTALRDQIAFYAQDFKDLGVLKPGTDSRRFAEHITVSVLDEPHRHGH
ncbi:MAG: ABC transporter substrate-binding protein [Azoarcus sp.]|jgi:NitT/TauT family transport system substrate-binding protein|nr:ABC transporter substrate-binding protein [Azoarcus sp.]